MGKDSKIEWTRHTGNLWHGCTHAQSIGCDHCYAETISKRWGRDIWGNNKPRLAIQSVWANFHEWQKAAAALNETHRVFVGSMMDIFEKPMPIIQTNNKGEQIKFNFKVETTKDLRDLFFEKIVPNSPNLEFLLLTKRPSNINKYIPESWRANPPANVMFGTSPVDQETANRLIPQLLKVNGRRFLSVEPMLDEITFRWAAWVDHDKKRETKGRVWHLDGLSGIDWIICGGESGPGKRPFNPDWARKIRNECKEAAVPFFMKQWDKIQAIPEDLMIRELPEGVK